MTPSRAALVLIAIAASVGCSSREWPSGTATATLFGPDGRLDSWQTSVVEGIHVHAGQPDRPCSAATMAEMAGAFAVAFPDKHEALKDPLKDLAATMTTLAESMTVQQFGPAHGGAGRTVVSLRRAGSDGSLEEAIVVDLPRLQAGEQESLFRAGDVKALYSRPALTPGARLDRGWVRVVRREGGRTEYDLFLVLRPVDAGAAVETLQVVTRVAWPPADAR